MERFSFFRLIVLVSGLTTSPFWLTDILDACVYKKDQVFKELTEFYIFFWGLTGIKNDLLIKHAVSMVVVSP